MPKRQGRPPKAVSPRIKEATEALQKASWMKPSFALKGAGYSAEEAKMDSVQVRLRRYRRSLFPLQSVQGGANQNLPMSPLTSSLNSTGTSTTSSATSATENSSARTSNPKKRKAINADKPAGYKEIRKTTSQAQQDRSNKQRVWEAEKEAIKEATIMFEIEKINRATTQPKKAAERSVNRKGPKGAVPPVPYKLLVAALGSYVLILQANGRSGEACRKKLVVKVNTVVAVSEEDDISTSTVLYTRLLRDSKVKLNSAVVLPVEDRRRRWTTFGNLSLWFDVWEVTLLKFKFAFKDGDKITIPLDQLERILNLDESKLSLDGSETRAGGRPAASLYCPDLPNLGRCATKSGQVATFIGGSTAAGEALPPHFQFSSKAATEENQRVSIDAFRHMVQVGGKFGHKEVQRFPVTVGVNEKGGMNDQEFEKYLCELVRRLYPDAADIDGKRVIVKVDSGPGRSNAHLILRLRMQGVLLYGGVPNATSVQQETDQTYGPFKSIYYRNLAKYAADRESMGMSTSANSSCFGLFVFGGADPLSQCIYENAFEKTFSKESCLKSWKAVGAAPLTRACLKNKKVKHDFTECDEKDPLASYLRSVQNQNILAVQGLNSMGYKAETLRAKLDTKTVFSTEKITFRYPEEKIAMIAACKSSGDKFRVTGGEHFNSDDNIKAMELSLRKNQAEQLKKDKKKRLGMEKNESEALGVLEQREGRVEALNGGDLTKLLKWYQVPVNQMGSKVADKRAKWLSIKNSNKSPPTYDKWTDEDEQKLQDLKSTNFTLKETQLGRLEDQRRAEFNAHMKAMSQEEFDEYVKQVRSQILLCGVTTCLTDENQTKLWSGRPSIKH